MSVRISPEMQENGFMIIPFPTTIFDEARKYIGRFIRDNTGSQATTLSELTHAVQLLSDDQFIDRFQKPFRMFPPEIASALLDWVDSLAPFIGGRQAAINYVSKTESQINANLNERSLDVFWRCVRPNKSDVGAAHCDYQFWEIAKGTPAEVTGPIDADERWKIWAPLFGCNSTNSLQVVPGSQREEIPTTTVQTRNGPKPSIDEAWLVQNEQRFIMPFKTFDNCCILFHDRLLHRGPRNNSDFIRISGELTILLAL